MRMTDASAPEKQPYHHGDLRRALLRHAEAELAENGVEGFSLRKLARRAGVSHAAPAHHFKDTKGLMTALAIEGYTKFIASMNDGAKEAQSPMQRLLGIGVGYVSFAQDHKALFRLIFASDLPNYDDPDLQDVADASFAVLTDTLAQARGGQGADTGAAYAMWAMVHGLSDLLTSGRLKDLQGLPKEAQKDQIEKILMRLVL